MHLRDEALLHALVLWRRGWLDRTLRTLTHLGDAAATIAGAAALLLLEPRGAGARAAFALAGSHLAVQAVKRSVSRPRPRLPGGIDSLVRAPDRFSFPSGHAAASLSVGLGLAATLPLPAAGAVLGLAGLVGVSRSYLGVHYPGDVLAGWLLAILGYAVAPPVLALLSDAR